MNGIMFVSEDGHFLNILKLRAEDNRLYNNAY